DLGVPVRRRTARPADPDAGASRRRARATASLDVLAGLIAMRVTRVLAPNPGIRELEGTHTWIVGDAPAIVVDPGPDDPGHLVEVARTAGSIGAIALTHDHPDHAPGALPLGAMTGAPVLAARPAEGMGRIRDGEHVSGGSLVLSVVGTPGHT